MISPEDIRRLFAYTRWANGMMLDAAKPLSGEEFLRAIGGSFGSIQATFAHLYGADWVWLERWHGRSPSSLPGPDELKTLDVIRSRWDTAQEGHRAFAETLSPDRMREPLTYVNFAGQTCTYPLGEALLHVANHGTYHRGQIATHLRQLGHKPPSTDYLRYIDAGGK
jgi:uncharacterized damage-inducible protein DinB